MVEDFRLSHHQNPRHRRSLDGAASRAETRASLGQPPVKCSVWSRFHIWKSFKSCWIKSCYTPPTKPRSALGETGPHWCATLCGNIFAGSNCEPAKSATARATREIREPTRKRGVGNRRPRGRKNRAWPIVPGQIARGEVRLYQFAAPGKTSDKKDRPSCSPATAPSRVYPQSRLRLSLARFAACHRKSF